MGRKAKKKTRQRALAPKLGPVDDRRGIVAEVMSQDGIEFDEPHVVMVVEPIRLDSGGDLYFQSPFVVPFYLLKSKTLRDGAERKRRNALTKTLKLDDGTLRPLSYTGTLDALEDLALSVILAVGAIEAHANDMIARLPDDAMVEVPTRMSGKTIAVMRDKTAMDWLSLSDKLGLAVPLLHNSKSIKGTVAWQKYKRLSRLRNALVHARREAINDPLKPGPFGKLMLGEGSAAPEDAALVIEAIEPGWIPDKIRPELSL